MASYSLGKLYLLDRVRANLHVLIVLVSHASQSILIVYVHIYLKKTFFFFFTLIVADYYNLARMSLLNNVNYRYFINLLDNIIYKTI